MAPKTSTRHRTLQHPFLLSVEDVVNQLGTNIETGLTARKVAELQKECPPNELEDGGGTVWHKILLKQIFNAMILVSYTPYIPNLLAHINLGIDICHGFEFWSRRLY
jgi:Na+-exporting ATPase